MTAPSFSTLVFRDLPSPDYADSIIVPIPHDVSADPVVWADAIFSAASMPRVVTALMRVRQLIVPFLGVRPVGRDAFAVREVRGSEALLSMSETHMECRIGVEIDPRGRLVRVTTAVALKGWRGRLYFAPLRVAHPVVVHAMMTHAAKELGRAAVRAARRAT